MTSPSPLGGVEGHLQAEDDSAAMTGSSSTMSTADSSAQGVATLAPSTSNAGSTPQHIMKVSQRAISPPTPAPSPQPEARRRVGRGDDAHSSLLSNPQTSAAHSTDLTTRGVSDDAAPLVQLIAREFPLLSATDRQAVLAQLIELCSARELAEVSSLISPRLKVDFLSALPIEVSLHVVSYLDDPQTLARASCVSRFWRSLVNDEHTWKVMCSRYRFRQLAVPLMSPRSLSQRLPRARSVSVADSEVSASFTASFDTAPAAEADEALRSGESLASLYQAYRARGLDAPTAYSELKTLHSLFLAKRAREVRSEERRRRGMVSQQLEEALELSQGVEYVARLAQDTMSEEDRLFYRQLEEEMHNSELQLPMASAHLSHEARLHSQHHSGDQSDNNGGWLSTGPTVVNRGSIGINPSTPTGPSSRTEQATRTPGMAPHAMGRNLGSHLISPTSRFGNMTSGLLTSLWDRTGPAAASPAAQGEHSSTEDSEIHHQAPSSGDHGHSSVGHAQDDEMQMDADDGQEHIRTDDRFVTLRGPRGDTVPDLSLPSHERRPSLQAMRFASGHRSVTAGDAGFSHSHLSGSGPSGPSRRSISSAFEHERSSRKGHLPSPFSYKTHFKLAYLTEQNWLRGGRLLTQHVSSVDASPEGNIVTSLSIDDEWIVVGMTNAKIHVFDARTGLFVKTLTGHSSGVWCLALISASSPFGSMRGANRSSKAHGKSRSRGGFEHKAPEDMDEDGPLSANPVGAYPYDSDRPLYTPTPDLNLIHHDPRPSASVFIPELFGSSSTVRPSMPTPRSQSFHHTEGSEMSPGDSETEDGGQRQKSNRSNEAEADANFRSGAYHSRGAGLGSNFGSPCGSVAGYGNEHAIVVSSGCDRDVRVWDLATGECKFVLAGHRSTVRCLRVFDGRPIAITGSRDGTMRVWNVETGQQVHLLAGHQHSVRCLDLAGNLVASASYDCTGRIWNVDTGKCVHVLRGHFHQLYAIAFDGVHVATGSLDTTVRVWSAETGECLALIQAHTSLVGQLQLTDSTLITGGSDGKVVVFDLKTMKVVYQLLAHGNSVTCLQFDDRFIVTGGNDGKVKLWDFKTGDFVRELCEASGQVWKVSFRDDKCVVLCKRNGKTAIDVISFRPIEEAA